MAIVQRFQNINPDSDGAYIKGPRDLKNEIQIITLPTELWTSWKTFLNKHIEGELIDLDTDKMFKEDRKFKLKQQTLKQRRYRTSGSKEHVSMEHGACGRRAPKQIKIRNPYSQICFPDFVEEEEEKCLNRTYYRVPYNRGLYGYFFLLGMQK